MKKVAKAILIALGIILVIGAVMVLGVNLYVQSAATHARIERGLGTGLHTQVKIGSLSFMPWYGLKLSGISREDGMDFGDGNSLEISDIKLRLQLWKLVRRNVVIKELTVDGVKVSWTQNAEGKWQLPGTSGSTEPPVQTGSLTGGEPPAPAPLPPAPSTPEPPVTVDHARLRDAAFAFYDKNHKSLAEFTGVFVQTPAPTDKLVQGSANIASVMIQRKFHLEDWRGRFKYTPGELSLFDTSCKVDEGTAAGSLDLKTAGQNSPFVFDTQFSDVNIDRMLADAGVTQVQASGDLSGALHLEGDSADSSRAQGRGRIVLGKGHITNSDLFETLDVLLHTDKFRELDIEDAHADFHIGGGRVFLDDLVVQTKPLTFSSQGGMAADGKDLSLKCRFAINGDVARQIPDFLMEGFGKDEATGARYVDFDITGDINHQDSTLTKVLGNNLKKVEKGVGNYLKKLIGGGKKTEPAPAATPAPTPASPGAPNP